MFNFFKNLFKSKEPTKPTSTIVIHDSENDYWGNTITVKGADTKWRAHGWKTPHVREGDVYAQQMTSGSKHLFRLVNVENCRDPRDMFFADAVPLGYWEDLPEYTLIKRETGTINFLPL